MRRAVKYCGGCNPRYDRVGAVRRVGGRPGEVLPAPPRGGWSDGVFVIRGCSARCADVSQLSAQRLVWVTEDILPSIE